MLVEFFLKCTVLFPKWIVLNFIKTLIYSLHFLIVPFTLNNLSCVNIKRHF